ncbi:MAG: hypothetical protein LBS99_06265 [Clostridiales bacterium]|jgi:hypothetical protein|nr:hypothetical protein [Clostridiales bacterium]
MKEIIELAVGSAFVTVASKVLDTVVSLVGVIIAALTFFMALFALIIARKQLRGMHDTMRDSATQNIKANAFDRAGVFIQLETTMRTNDRIFAALRLIEDENRPDIAAHPWYDPGREIADGRFLPPNARQNEENIDALFGCMSCVCYLSENGLVEESELGMLKYRLKKIIASNCSKQYLEHNKFHAAQRSETFSFESLLKAVNNGRFIINR